MKWFAGIEPTDSERHEHRAGDQLVPRPDVTMDRGFTVPGTPEMVWPWIVQLGKKRAGWYFPRSAERFIPPRRRGARRIQPQWQSLSVGDVIPDYGGAHETFKVAQLELPTTVVYTSVRSSANVSWSITLRPLNAADSATSTEARTRVLFRLKLGPVKHVRLATIGGELIDLLTISALASGLRERMTQT